MTLLKVFVAPLLLLLVACSQPTTPLSAISSAPPSPAPAASSAQPILAPAADKATMAGRIVTNTDRTPVKQTVVRLAQVYHDQKTSQAVFAMDIAKAPGTFSDAQGGFVFSDLPPGEYVIVVGDYYGENDIVREPNGDAKVFKAEAGKTLDVGTLQVRPNLSPGR